MHLASPTQMGIATIPARPGHWHFHLGTTVLRAAGFAQIPEQHLMVPSGDGDPVTLNLIATPFSNSLPEVTDIQTTWGNVIFTGKGEPGQLYEVEGSFDLNSWFFAGR
ncbi:MAG: hypothetical protein LR015_12950 [Verrucomicrobia bacterium]|nr:hypothetical protein [Verrucomicrobiota bacterium]